MTLEEIIKEGSEYSIAEIPDGRTERIGIMLPALLQTIQGNVLEIGAGEGVTTKPMLEAAKQFDRRVLVVDPWHTLPDQPQGYGQYSYKEFVQRTSGFTNLTVCQSPSHTKVVNRYMAEMMPFAFAFVDGLQLEYNVLSDLFLCSAYGVEVICVDDINRETEISQVPKAVQKFITGNNKYRLVATSRNLIECYLIKSY